MKTRLTAQQSQNRTPHLTTKQYFNVIILNSHLKRKRTLDLDQICNCTQITNTMALLKWITLLQVLLLLPTHTISSCQNSETFTKEVDGELRYCKWFRFKEWRREEHCLDRILRRNCPQVCTGCCEDSPTFEFRLSSANTIVTCAWITANSNKKKDCMHYQIIKSLQVCIPNIMTLF